MVGVFQNFVSILPQEHGKSLGFLSSSGLITVDFKNPVYWTGSAFKGGRGEHCCSTEDFAHVQHINNVIMRRVNH